MKYFLILFAILLNSCSTGNQQNKKKSIDANYSLAYPDIVIKSLPDEINETSGLIYIDSLYWTNNDSGGDACIYGFSQVTGKIKRRVCLSGVKNIDWEELCEDSENIYIGDLGNNNGNRKDLCIYIIKKNDVKSDTIDEIAYGKITFKWEDQTDFSRAHHKTAFDCEAFICQDDSLFLFAKDWANKETRMYYLPNIPGDYIAQKLDSFNVNGLITGADISDNGNELVMVGYRAYKSFIWLFSDIKNHDFLGGNAKRYNLFQFDSVQTEAVNIIDDCIYISCEKSATPASLFKLNLKSLK